MISKSKKENIVSYRQDMQSFQQQSQQQQHRGVPSRFQKPVVNGNPAPPKKSSLPLITKSVIFEQTLALEQELLIDQLSECIFLFLHQQFTTAQTISATSKNPLHREFQNVLKESENWDSATWNMVFDQLWSVESRQTMQSLLQSILLRKMTILVAFRIPEASLKLKLPSISFFLQALFQKVIEAVWKMPFLFTSLHDSSTAFVDYYKQSYALIDQSIKRSLNSMLPLHHVYQNSQLTPLEKWFELELLQPRTPQQPPVPNKTPYLATRASQMSNVNDRQPQPSRPQQQQRQPQQPPRQQRTEGGGDVVVKPNNTSKNMGIVGTSTKIPNVIDTSVSPTNVQKQETETSAQEQEQGQHQKATTKTTTVEDWNSDEEDDDQENIANQVRNKKRIRIPLTSASQQESGMSLEDQHQRQTDGDGRQQQQTEEVSYEQIIDGSSEPEDDDDEQSFQSEIVEDEDSAEEGISRRIGTRDNNGYDQTLTRLVRSPNRNNSQSDQQSAQKTSSKMTDRLKSMLLPSTTTTTPNQQTTTTEKPTATVIVQNTGDKDNINTS